MSKNLPMLYPKYIYICIGEEYIFNSQISVTAKKLDCPHILSEIYHISYHNYLQKFKCKESTMSLAGHQCSKSNQRSQILVLQCISFTRNITFVPVTVGAAKINH